MDAVVQLLRNALCCIKDLNLLSSTILHDPSYTSKFYSFPSPHLNQTTPLEIIISLTQLYACVSCSISGFRLIKHKGIIKLQKLTKIADFIKEKYKHIKSKKVANFIKKSIMDEASSAFRDALVGICVLSIGISFFWLFANSLHITAAGWIGGLPALIHALTVMEVALVPLLYWMIKDAASNLSKAKRIQAFVEKIGNLKIKPAKGDDSWLDYETFTLLQGEDWSSLWSGSSKFSSKGMEQDKIISKDIEVIETKIKVLTTGDKNIVSEELAQSLQQTAIECKFEGYREYLYFILNFIAFYGYLMGIIVYYFEEENEASGIKSLKFGATHEFADWTGNFVGDFMWTVEPILILSSPFLLRRMMKYGETKIKSD